MPHNITIVGVPGAGKTTYATQLAANWFKQGVNPKEVAYLAFTKAAAYEAAGRMIDSAEDPRYMEENLPYFRTIHSLAYRGLKRERKDIRLVTTADMKAFSKWSSMEGTFAVEQWEDMAAVYQKLEKKGKTDWDDCLRGYVVSRICAKNKAELEMAKVRMHPKAANMVGFMEDWAYASFVAKYESYKHANSLIDFSDMLTFAMTEMAPLDDVKHVVIDEAQDLSAICYQLVDRLFQNAETIWWAGDEDQSIYLFSGADANLFIDRFNRGKAQVFLRETHRYGQEIVDLSGTVIRRVANRIPKGIIGMAGKKHDISLTGEFKPFVGKALLLHRHVAGCQALTEAYVQAGMPFRSERGGRNPLGDSKKVRAFETLSGLAEGKAVSGGAVTDLLKDFMPSRAVDRGKKVALMAWGIIKKLQAEDIPGHVTLNDLKTAKILTHEGASVISNRYYNTFESAAEEFEYFHRVIGNGYSISSEDVPVITTIHGSKGREAPKVVVFSEMGKKCWDDPDSEHRLAYVAATRTSGSLEVSLAKNVDWAEHNYDYPVESRFYKKEGDRNGELYERGDRGEPDEGS